MGFFDEPQPYLFQLYAESLQPSSGSRPRARATASRPDAPARAASTAPSTRCRSGTRPSARPAVDLDAFPLHAITQRPAAMYHSWGSQNAWLRQIHGAEPALSCPARSATSMGFADGDWVDVISPHGRITVPVARMEALNPHTVWTWNAIGKRPGAWALDPDAPEATRGFLLNHLIHELLPPRGDGHALVELRPGHRPGRLVRPARPHRARARPQPQRPGLPGPGLARSAAARTASPSARRRLPRPIPGPKRSV